MPTLCPPLAVSLTDADCKIHQETAGGSTKIALAILRRHRRRAERSSAVEPPTQLAVFTKLNKGVSLVKKCIKAVILIVFTLVILLRIFSANLIISCDFDMPNETYEAIESQAEGIYSNKLPLVAVYVNITDYSDGIAYYTIHYFPFGSVDMSFSETDGYNIEKPLTKLS